MYKKVVNIEWEGDTLIMETEDGEVFRYENAHITDIKYDYEDDENIVVEKIPFRTGKVLSNGIKVKNSPS